MGKFLTAPPELQQNIEKPELWAIKDRVEYQSNIGEIYIVPIDFETDGYSKPDWSHILVGHNFKDDVRPAVLHDWLCFKKEVTFNKANNLFYEAMLAVSIAKWKAKVMRFAVNFNDDKW